MFKDGLYFLKQLFQFSVAGNPSVLKQLGNYRRWKYYLSPGRNSVTDKLPWITFPAIDFLNNHLEKNSRVFEFGGGGSTLYFLQKEATVITVEHDAQWFSRLQENISPGDKAHWDGNLVLPEQPADTTGLDISDPAHYFSGDPGFANATFKTYSSFIDRYPDCSFDVVLVDGRSRTSCLYHSIPKVKINGYLLLDNSERSYYLKNNYKLPGEHYKLLINAMAPVPFSHRFSRTTVWQRIK